MTKLQRAKKVSLEKWEAVLAEFPNCWSMESLLYGPCGFCEEYADKHSYCDEDGAECTGCPLGKLVKPCDVDGSLYNRIQVKVYFGETRGLKVMLKNMIKAIKEAKE